LRSDFVMGSNKHLTTGWGAPVGDNQNSMTAGSRGPTLIQDVHLLEKLAHFNRERVPERVVVHEGELSIRSRQTHPHVHSLLHRRRRVRLGRYGARSAWICREVLYGRRQL
jgi:hypothetical protein